MLQRRRDHREELVDRIRVAGEVHDQGAAGDAADPARQQRERLVTQALDQHRLLERGRLALDDGARRLGRHVVPGQARASGRADEPHVVGDERAQPRLDRRRVVGEDLDRQHLAARLPQQFGEPRAGAVLAVAAGEARRDREDCGAHQAGTVPARGP